MSSHIPCLHAHRRPGGNRLGRSRRADHGAGRPGIRDEGTGRPQRGDPARPGPQCRRPPRRRPRRAESRPLPSRAGRRRRRVRLGRRTRIVEGRVLPPTQELWRSTVDDDGCVHDRARHRRRPRWPSSAPDPANSPVWPCWTGYCSKAPSPTPATRPGELGTFVVAAECGSPAGTCFCTSMGTGPGAETGFDLALTEIDDGGGHRFVVRVGHRRGARRARSGARVPRHGRRSRRPRAGHRFGRRCHRPPARDRGLGRAARPQPRPPPLGRGGRAVPGLWELHPGLPDLLLQRRVRHHRPDRRRSSAGAPGLRASTSTTPTSTAVPSGPPPRPATGNGSPTSCRPGGTSSTPRDASAAAAASPGARWAST